MLLAVIIQSPEVELQFNIYALLILSSLMIKLGLLVDKDNLSESSVIFNGALKTVNI